MLVGGHLLRLEGNQVKVVIGLELNRQRLRGQNVSVIAFVLSGDGAHLNLLPTTVDRAVGIESRNLCLPLFLSSW